jgi:hypothetical protein
VNTPTRKNPVCIYNGKLEIREIPDNWQSLEFIELFGQEDSVELMFLCSVEFFREPLEFFAENATQHYSLMYTWPSATERRIMGVPLFILYDKSESLWRE